MVMENIQNIIDKRKRRLEQLLSQQSQSKEIGMEGIDYITCHICTLKIKSSRKRHYKCYHIDFDYDRHMAENPALKKHPDVYLKATTKPKPNHWTKSPDARKKQSLKMKGVKNPNHKHNTTELQRKSASPNCIEFYERKYPDLSNEERLFMLKENINKVMDTRGKNIPIFKEYWMNKGHSEKEAIKLVSDRQTTFSLEICIAKYGECEGFKIWEKRQEKWRATIRNNYKGIGSNLSAISLELFDIINEIYDTRNFLYGKKEKWLSNDNRELVFSYDFTDPIKRKIIEFNGDYWHMNPNKYKSDDINTVKQKTAKEIWKRDEIKIQLAQKCDYETLTIWEDEYRNNPTEILKLCMDFLNR